MVAVRMTLLRLGEIVAPFSGIPAVAYGECMATLLLLLSPAGGYIGHVVGSGEKAENSFPGYRGVILPRNVKS
jgi:hypothetical protein